MKNILYLSILCIFFSCDIINPEEEIPSFIEIESITVNAIPESGTNMHNFTEAWVFVDNELIGAFVPGKPFPVLASGSSEILVQAGIHEDGISVATKIYPYMSRYEVTENLVPGEVTTINPVFEYADNIEIEFETVGALEGQSAKIVLDAQNPVVNVATILNFALPISSFNDTYLEINFKTDAPIAIGLVSNDSFGELEQLYSRGLNSTPSWKKVYINLQETIALNPAISYQVGFGAELPAGLAEATIMIDNIKLLHFKP